MEKLRWPNVVDCWPPTVRIPERVGAHDSPRGLASVGRVPAVRARFSTGRHTRQIFDYAKVPELALGDAGINSRVECHGHSYFVAKNCAVEVSKEDNFRVARDSSGTRKWSRTNPVTG